MSGKIGRLATFLILACSLLSCATQQQTNVRMRTLRVVNHRDDVLKVYVDNFYVGVSPPLTVACLHMYDYQLRSSEQNTLQVQPLAGVRYAAQPSSLRSHDAWEVTIEQYLSNGSYFPVAVEEKCKGT